MNKQSIAQASVRINNSDDSVWNALINPEVIAQYMFGTKVVSDWKVGSKITWKGVWNGKAYEDKGKILKLEKEKIIQYNHFSPLSGKQDTPENYHTVTVKLSVEGNQTILKLSQDNNETEEERERSEKNWQMMLDSLKKLLEKQISNL